MVPKNWDAEPEGHQREYGILNDGTAPTGGPHYHAVDRRHVLNRADNTITKWDPYGEVIHQLITLHNRKKSDYAADDNQYSNFEASAKFAGVTPLQAFDVLIGTKIARLQNLKESGKDVMNESIQDTEFDLANYLIIKRSYILHLNSKGTLPASART